MIYDNRLKEAWKKIHSPKYQFLSRHDGGYSNNAGFIKDTAVTLSELWEIGKDSNYYREWCSDAERAEAINALDNGITEV